MQSSLRRRDFLSACVIPVAGALLVKPRVFALEPFQRKGHSRLLLSLAAYSFRNYFRDSSHAREKPADKQIDLFNFVDFCADHGCVGAELTSYYFPPSVDDAFLLKLRRHAFLRGVAISGTAVGNTFTHPPGDKRDREIARVKEWIDHAAILGAPHIRVFAGSAPRELTKEEAKKHCVAAVEECADYAGKKGIFLGLENHGGIVEQPQDLLGMIREIKSSWVGINLDSANFHTDDPYRDFAECAPYAVNVQIKAEIHAQGSSEQPADLPRLVKILREANYQGYVALEYESKPDPFEAVPGLLKRLQELLVL